MTARPDTWGGFAPEGANGQKNEKPRPTTPESPARSGAAAQAPDAKAEARKKGERGVDTITRNVQMKRYAELFGLRADLPKDSAVKLDLATTEISHLSLVLDRLLKNEKFTLPFTREGIAVRAEDDQRDAGTVGRAAIKAKLLSRENGFYRQALNLLNEQGDADTAMKALEASVQKHVTDTIAEQETFRKVAKKRADQVEALPKAAPNKSGVMRKPEEDDVSFMSRIGRLLGGKN